MTPDPFFLTSRRLGFRTWRPDDLPLATALWQDPEVMQWLGGPYPDAQIRARFQDDLDLQATRGVQYWPVFLRGTGEHVGVAGLRPWTPAKACPQANAEADTPREPDVYEAGVHVHRRFWSGRFGEEAARAAIRYAFRDLRAQALIARHHPENIASLQLIQRLGFSREQDTFWSVTGLFHATYRLDRDDARAESFRDPVTYTE